MTGCTAKEKDSVNEIPKKQDRSRKQSVASMALSGALLPTVSVLFVWRYMMAKYRPVYTGIWDDEDQFLNYTDSQKILFLYLITNEGCTVSGIYKISYRKVTAILGWTEAKLKSNLPKLSPNVLWDVDTNIIFIKNFLKYNGLKHGNPSVIANAIKKDAEIYHTSLWYCFNDTYSKFKVSLDKDTLYFGQSIYNNLGNYNDLGNDKKESTINADACANADTDAIEKIYKQYPSKCPHSKRSTGKSHKNKDQIKRILKNKVKTSDELMELQKKYISDCDRSKTYYKNYGTFLNQLPEIGEEEKSYLAKEVPYSEPPPTNAKPITL